MGGESDGARLRAKLYTLTNKPGDLTVEQEHRVKRTDYQEAQKRVPEEIPYAAAWVF
jgi:hypothetical protein